MLTLSLIQAVVLIVATPHANVSRFTFQEPASSAARSAENNDSVRAVKLDDHDAVRAMEQVYSGSEFWWKRQQKVDTPSGPLEWLAKWIGRFFKWVWDNLFWPVLKAIGALLVAIWNALRSLLSVTMGSSGVFVGTIVLSVVLLCILGWLGWKVHPMLWQWLKTGEGSGRLRSGQPLEQEQLPEARVLLEQAAEAFEYGRFREALRFGFLALLASLQYRGLLRYDRARTNREYLSDLRAQPHLAVVFREAARPYERAWFGQITVSRDDAAHVLGVCRQIVMEQEAART